MTPNVAMPTPSAPKPAAGGARSAAAHDPARASAPAGDSRFDRQFDQAMKQHNGDAELAAQAATPVVPPRIVLPQTEPGPAVAGKDGETTDPAERDGNALAVAVLALLGQGVAAPATGVGAAAKAAGLSLDVDKGGARPDGASTLLAATAKGTEGAASAVTPASGGDASALIAVTTQAVAPDTRKGEQATGIDALAAPIAPHTAAANASQVAHSLKMDAPAGSQTFAQELGQQVAWLGGQEIKQARIRLRPEELGQLDVKVSVAEHGRVDVSFTAQHPAAVTAVQQTLGQLDLMLAGHGLSLGQAQVGQQGGRGGGSEQGGPSGDTSAGEVESPEPVTRPIAVGLLDTFA